MAAGKKDFIIKVLKDTKTGKEQNILRRYKGKDSEVVIPDGVTKIADYVFADDIEPNKTIEKIIIPDSVTEISYRAFAFCKNLNEIQFPRKLKKFEIDFKYCPSIEEVSVPQSVTIIMIPSLPKHIKKVNVGDNIIAVEFTNNHGGKLNCIKPQVVAEIILQNPVYREIDGFVINTAKKTTLFRTDFTKTEVRVPDGVEVIGPNTFYEFYQLSKIKKEMKPIEKVIIPKSVKKIQSVAFINCSFLQEVVYEGLTKKLEVDKWAFLMCVNFHKDGREIICKDTPKKKEKSKGKGVGWDRLTRLFVIDRAIKSGTYPDADKLIALCKAHGIKFGKDGNTDCSPKSTIHRDLDDILMFSNTLCEERGDLIKYDYGHKGYYYTRDFKLDFEGILLNL
ncbi:MAG: leucine-rich repeat protein [Treponema sp.]|nr:leucine-rich repeat protein [Treponema sp.]